jgi:hypothetical protein
LASLRLCVKNSYVINDRKAASQSEGIREHPIHETNPNNNNELASGNNRLRPLPSEQKAGIVAGIKSDTRNHAPYR